MGFGCWFCWFALTSGVSRLGQTLDVKGFGDVVLDGGPVPPHHRADGLGQTAQVVEHLKGCSHLGRVLSKDRTQKEFMSHYFLSPERFYLSLLLCVQVVSWRQSAGKLG